MDAWPEPVERVAAVLREQGADARLEELPGGTPTAAATGAISARIADPAEVLAATGFEPGAVAPFPVPGVGRVFLDRELLVQELVWIGAGSSRHMAGLAPIDLLRLARAMPVDLAEG